jgi:hypothetical protein
MAAPKKHAVTAQSPERHPSTTHFSRFFAYGHLSPEAQEVSAPCSELAKAMVEKLPDGPELSAGLRKLLEAKDCFVRASLAK